MSDMLCAKSPLTLLESDKCITWWSAAAITCLFQVRALSSLQSANQGIQQGIGRGHGKVERYVFFCAMVS